MASDAAVALPTISALDLRNRVRTTVSVRRLPAMAQAIGRSALKPLSELHLLKKGLELRWLKLRPSHKRAFGEGEVVTRSSCATGDLGRSHTNPAVKRAPAQVVGLALGEEVLQVQLEAPVMSRNIRRRRL